MKKKLHIWFPFSALALNSGFTNYSTLQELSQRPISEKHYSGNNELDPSCSLHNLPCRKASETENIPLFTNDLHSDAL